MEEMLVKVETGGIGYTSPTLRKATEIINKIGDNIRKEAFHVAAIIAEVDVTGAYELDGFESVHDWTKHAFGWEKSQSYNFLKIGKEYTAISLDKSGKANGWHCDLGSGFSTSQVIKMLPLGHTEAVKAVEDGVISAEMSVRDIAAKVKELTKKTEEELEEPDTGASEEDESEDREETPEILVRVMDTHGNAYEVPLEILTKYKVGD